MLVMKWRQLTKLLIFFFISCWIQYDNAMLFAEIIPITVLVIASIMMIEAAGSVDESTMSRLEGSLWEKNYQNFRVWYLLVHFSETSHSYIQRCTKYLLKMPISKNIMFLGRDGNFLLNFVIFKNILRKFSKRSVKLRKNFAPPVAGPSILRKCTKIC